MARSKKAVSCPAETTLKIIGGRWKLMILRQLAAGASRFGELHRDLNALTPSGKTLKPIIEAMHEWGTTHSSRDKNF